MPTTTEIRPYAWWIKIKDVPGAPRALVMERDGRIRGGWYRRRGGDIERVWLRLSDDDLRGLGFEKCFCGPELIAADCPVHSKVDGCPDSGGFRR
jgi:hypothetical protein